MNHRIFRSSPLPPPKLKAWPIGALRYFNLWNPSPSQFKTIKRSWPICKKHAPVSVNSNITIEGHCRVDVLMVFFMKILLEGITTTWANSSNFSVLDYLPCDYLKENFFFFYKSASHLRRTRIREDIAAMPVETCKHSTENIKNLLH